MRLLLASVALLLAVWPIHVAAQQRVNGQWSFLFSPTEYVHKLIYSYGNSNDGAAYFRCEPGSGQVEFLHDVRGQDIRSYSPSIRLDNIRYESPYAVEYDEFSNDYYFMMRFDPVGDFGRSFPNSRELQVDDWIYPINDRYDPIIIREFFRTCAQ